MSKFFSIVIKTIYGKNRMEKIVWKKSYEKWEFVIPYLKVMYNVFQILRIMVLYEYN
jgi:hypothetical protein